MNYESQSLQFGIVKVEWLLPRDVSPIGVAHWALNGKKVYCLNADLHYTLGSGPNAIPLHVPMFDLVDGVPARWTFDGASVPRWLQFVTGIDPLGWHVWGVIPHDKCCDDANDNRYPRTIGDAIFLEVLENSKPEKYWEAVKMYAGVRAYSIGKKWRERKVA